MMDKLFAIQLTGAKLNMLGGLIEQQKLALDALSVDIQGQVNATLAAEAKAAAKVAEAMESASTSDVNITTEEPS